MDITVAPHPLLRLHAFVSRFDHALGDVESPDWLRALLAIDAEAPVARDESTRAGVRDMLRAGGYKPTGRGKPASEYLVRAATEGTLLSINAAVDACNAVSLHSGLPISLIDVDRATPPLSVRIASEGSAYVFNAAGQEIDVAGLLCVHYADGPCANAVKDSQRTKTSADTTATLSIIWGIADRTDLLDEAARWYRDIVARLGASTADVRRIAEVAAEDDTSRLV